MYISIFLVSNVNEYTYSFNDIMVASYYKLDLKPFSLKFFKLYFFHAYIIMRICILCYAVIVEMKIIKPYR